MAQLIQDQPSGLYYSPSQPLVAVVTLQNAAVATGVGTPLPVSGYGIASLDVYGTFVGTITFQGQGIGGNWYTVMARNRTTGALATTTTGIGLFEVNCQGLTNVQANITAYTSGSVTVKGTAQAIAAGVEYVSMSGSTIAVPVDVQFSSLPTTNPLPVSVVGSLTNMSTGVITVTTGQIELTNGMSGRKQLIIYPPSVGTIYWGMSGVTSGTGIPLAAGGTPVVFNFAISFQVFAVSDGTNRNVSVVESK